MLDTLPLFSKDVVSAKKEKQEGRPKPKETPVKANNKKMLAWL